MAKLKGIGKGKAPNSLANLKSYKKGQSGNLKGRPEGSISLRERMAKFINLNVQVKMPDGSIKDQTIMDSIIMSLLSKANKGDIRAIEVVLDRNFGKEPEKYDIEDSGLRETVKTLQDKMDLHKKHEKPY